MLAGKKGEKKQTGQKSSAVGEREERKKGARVNDKGRQEKRTKYKRMHSVSWGKLG